MNVVSSLLIALMAALLMVTIGRLIVAIAGDVLRSNRVRANLKDRLRLLRMNKMLARRNIPLDEYLHGESVSDVEQRVRACVRVRQTLEATVEDEVLACGELRIEQCRVAGNPDQ